MNTATRDSFQMDCSIGNVIYCSVSRGKSTLYMYNAGDRQIETLAGLCLENFPPFHAEYFHTAGDRTFGFLMEDGYTYFAIVDDSKGSLGVRRFLRHFGEGYKKASRNGFHDELVPAIRRLMQSLDSMSRPSMTTSSAQEELPISTKVPLLGIGKIGKLDRKRSRGIDVGDIGVGDEHTSRGIRIDVPSEERMGPMNLQKSSSARMRMQQMTRRSWWRHVKIVILVDILLCSVLFCIWLAICRGLQCVSD